jgi:hypothetical protein
MDSTQKSPFRKVLIVIFYVLLGLLLVALGVGYFGLKPLLTKRIQTAVLNSTDKLYHLDFKDIKYDIMTGNAYVLDVAMVADSTLYESLRKDKKMPDNIYQGRVKEINLTGLKLWTVITSEKLALKSINIDSPIIEVTHEKQPYNSFKTAQSPYQIISKFVKSFSVNKVTFNNINFTYKKSTNPKNAYPSKLENLDLEVSNLLINAESEKDTTRFYYTKECIFKLDKLSFPTRDSLNTLKINAIDFSTKTRSLSIDNIILQPRYKPMIYGNHTRGDDRIGVICKKLKFENMDMKKLFEDKKIYADVLKINQGNVTVFTDTRDFHTPKKGNYRPFPHQSFKDLPAKFYIKKMKLRNFNVVYSEYNPETDLVGNVKFNHINGTFSNLTNDTIPLLENPHCIVFLKAKLMNKADMYLKFNFNIDAPKGDFTVSGKVYNMRMDCVNHVIKSLAMAKADDGFVKMFSFDMKGNKYGLNGSSTLVYNDLKVSFFKNKDDDKTLKKRKFLSFIANTFVIKDSNPIRKKPVRVAMINYRRVPEKAFFYTLWKGLVEGLKGSVM